MCFLVLFFFFSSRRRHTRCSRDWSSDVCSSDLFLGTEPREVWRYRAAAVAPHLARLGAEEGVARPALATHERFEQECERRPRDFRSEERRVGKEWRKRSTHDGT